MRIVIFFIIFCGSITASWSQVIWANQVLAHQFGLGQTVGQSSDYFPQNVLGKVSASATPTSPANLPDEIVSLGRNGWIVLGFEHPIVDGVGDDFIVFENAFNYPLGVFDEWLTVSVSEDGTNWIDFPADTLTGAGMAGRTPTNGASPVFDDVLQCGGDGFDLATLGLSHIRFVKVSDATQYQTPDKLSAELDAIVAIHYENTAETSTNIPPQILTTTLTENHLLLSTQSIPIHLEITTLTGQKIWQQAIPAHSNYTLAKQNFPHACYVLQVKTASNYFFQKIMW